jgi:cephalosporin hydroxylase
MKVMKKFIEERIQNIAAMASDKTLSKSSNKFFCDTARYKYSYNFDWMSRPIIQYPQDIVAYQEIVWKVKPDLIIETGIAHGGSLILSASLLTLLDICEEGKASLQPFEKKPRCVIGIDIDIRQHNLDAIEKHPLSPRIKLFQGSSIDKTIINQVKEEANKFKKIMICLDSNHTHEHVLAELEAYAPLTSSGSYCIVFDTVISDMPKKMHLDRQWGPTDNPKSAVKKYISNHPEFEIDKSIQNKLLITVAPDGYLKRK